MPKTLTRHVPAPEPSALVVLMILSAAGRPMLAKQIEMATGPRGLRTPVDSALDFLDEHKLIERDRPTPAIARWGITADGELYMANVDRTRCIRELERRIAVLSKPHKRDKEFTPPPEASASLKQLLAIVRGEASVQLARPRVEPETTDDVPEEMQDEDGELLDELQQAPAPKVRPARGRVVRTSGPVQRIPELPKEPRRRAPGAPAMAR